MGAIERRAADGRVDHAAAGTVFGGGVRLSAAGHAALPEVRAGPALDDGVRLGGQREAVSISAQILALPERETGTAYPAVLFFTGASDTRVDPLHARKMTALLQADSSSGRPVLLHYSVAGGHSAGVSVEQTDPGRHRPADVLWTETGQPAVAEVTIRTYQAPR